MLSLGALSALQWERVFICFYYNDSFLDEEGITFGFISFFPVCLVKFFSSGTECMIGKSREIIPHSERVNNDQTFITITVSVLVESDQS